MENTMKKYKVIALSALIAAGFTSCDLTEKPTSYYEKDTYFETMDQAKIIGIIDRSINFGAIGQ